MTALPSWNSGRRLLFAARSLRSFAYGWLSVILALHLDARGFSAPEIGALFAATMVEDAFVTMALSTLAQRLGPARVMAATAPLIAFGGLLLAVAESRFWLVAGMVLGTLSPNGQEAGPFTPLEQSLLPRSVRSGRTVRTLGWYNLVGLASAAAGAAAAGLAMPWAIARGLESQAALRVMLLVYAAAGALLTLFYAALARLTHDPAPRPAQPGRLGLGRSRPAVLQLAGLQAVDALAGGFIMQGLLAYWLHLRFGVGPAAIGALFFGTNLLSALSFLAATRIAERFGLLNTMVFTHLPSNVLLLAIPFMPSFESAGVLLLLRHLLSQMDVPTRQAYTLALVTPEERPAASGLTMSVRALAQAVAPAVVGLTMATAATPLPFLLAGSLKIGYDLALYFRFRSIPLQA